MNKIQDELNRGLTGMCVKVGFVLTGFESEAS